MGTTETLLFVAEEWHHLTKPVQNGGRTPVVNAVFLDIAKCFDRIDRRLLLHKLRTEGGIPRRLIPPLQPRVVESILGPGPGPRTRAKKPGQAL